MHPRPPESAEPTAAWCHLSPHALAADRFEALATGILMASAGSVIGWVWDPLPQAPLRPVLLAGLTLLVIWLGLELAVLAPRRHRAVRYRVADGALEVARGVLVVGELLVPLPQVLYVDVRRGPIARLVGLRTVRVGTLGSTHDVGPLTPDAAAQLVRALRQDPA